MEIYELELLIPIDGGVKVLNYFIGKMYKEEKRAIGENQYTIPKNQLNEDLNKILNTNSKQDKSGVATVTTPQKDRRK